MMVLAIHSTDPSDGERIPRHFSTEGENDSRPSA